jgi:hypothetical protein
MNVTEIAVMSTVLVSLAVLRFGLPLAITWAVGKAARRLTHTA